MEGKGRGGMEISEGIRKYKFQMVLDASQGK